jgi:pilus assembly protein Flp/PilA
MTHLLNTLVADESGQDLIEYALMAALVGLGTVAAMQNLSSSIYNFYAAIANALGQTPTH